MCSIFFLFFFLLGEGILFSEKRKQENEKHGERKGERNEKEVEVWRKGETKIEENKKREGVGGGGGKGKSRKIVRYSSWIFYFIFHHCILIGYFSFDFFLCRH